MILSVPRLSLSPFYIILSNTPIQDPGSKNSIPVMIHSWGAWGLSPTRDFIPPQYSLMILFVYYASYYSLPYTMCLHDNEKKCYHIFLQNNDHLYFFHHFLKTVLVLFYVLGFQVNHLFSSYCLLGVL